MPDQSDDITKLMTETLHALASVKNDQNATDEDKKKAKEAYEDVMMLLGRQSVANYEGRTAMLTGLIVELHDVTKNVQLDPVGATMKKIADLAAKATTLFKAEKGARSGQS